MGSSTDGLKGRTQIKRKIKIKIKKEEDKDKKTGSRRGRKEDAKFAKIKPIRIKSAIVLLNLTLNRNLTLCD